MFLFFSDLLLCYCTQIYVKNNAPKFYPDPIWNDGALGFFEDRRPNNNKN